MLLLRAESFHFVGFLEGLSVGNKAQPGSGGRAPRGWAWSSRVPALSPILSTWDTTSMTDTRVSTRWALNHTDDKHRGSGGLRSLG